jgi:hypothetical protein
VLAVPTLDDEDEEEGDAGWKGMLGSVYDRGNLFAPGGRAFAAGAIKSINAGPQTMINCVTLGI